MEVGFKTPFYILFKTQLNSTVPELEIMTVKLNFDKCKKNPVETPDK